MRTLPSPWSIVWTDTDCFRNIAIAPMILFIGLAIKLTGTIPGHRGRPATPVDPEVATIVLACAVALILLLSADVARRVSRTRHVLARGREVEAAVRKVRRGRGGTTLKLEYELDGIPYKARLAFQRWLRTPAFIEGTRIPVLVDPMNPKRAVPLALYADPGATHGGDGPTAVQRPKTFPPRFPEG